MTIFDWQEEVKARETPPPTIDIVSFKDTAREWAKKVVDLNNTQAKTSELQKTKATLLKWAGVIRKGVETITGSIDEFEKAGLGFPVIIPVAVIAASLAAMAKWTADYMKFKKAVALQQELISGGTSPKTASEMVSTLLKTGKVPLVNIAYPKTLGVLALAIGGYWFAKNQKWIK